MTHLKPASLLALAVMIMAATGLAGSASAQETTMEVSAERFFGEGVLQVVIDTGADDDNVVEELQVDIDARPGSGSASSDSILVPETSESSGKFEFFLMHVDAVVVGPTDLDPDNSAGVEGDGTCVADCAPLVTFGPGGFLDVQAGLYDEVDFEIREGNVEVEVNYEQANGALELDRDSYGTSSFVYVSVADQDANLNPTERDEFTVDPDSVPNDDLLELDGGTFEDIITFTETGDNTAVFEGRYRLGVSILAGSESLVLTLHEKANYNATLAAAENDSNNISEIGFTIGNSDGSIDVGGGQQTVPTWDPALAADSDSYAVGESVHVTITDQDANVQPGIADSINLQISSGNSNIEVPALETGVSTGVFETSFQLAQETDAESGAIAPGGSAIITYTDERPADYSEKVQAGENPEKDFSLEIDVQLPIRTGTESTKVTAPLAEDVAGGTGPYAVDDSLTLSMTISNNNDQPQLFVALLEVRDSHSVTVFIALQAGTLEPLSSADIGVLWQPDRVGIFEARTFAVAEIGGGEVLSLVATSEITVGQVQ
jgi:hypothetical protein